MDDAVTSTDDEPARGSDDPLAELAPVSHAIFRVARLHKMLAGQLLRQAGLYPNQELIMMRLWTEGPQRQVDLVRMLESEAPTITRTIRRLEKAGLVRTSQSPTDRRSIIVEATPASMPLRSQVEQAWATLEAWTVDHWGESRREDVLETLTALETNLLEAEHREELFIRPRGSVISLNAVSNAPIGIFDSGVGGLTVARAVLDQLPNEPIRYVGDTARGPYGPRTIAEVRAYALEVLDHLVEQGVKMLVIACNSASSAVLRDARERYDVPVVEVIQPAVRRAVRATRNDSVGVIGTRATVASMAYDDAFAAATHIKVTSAACPRFVEFVERGVTMSDELLEAAHAYLRPVADAGVDTLVLGCTHYPLLTGAISYVMGDAVTLVSSAEETAKDVYRVLHDHGIARGESLPPPVHRFLATGPAEPFAELGHRFLGPEIGTVETAPMGVLAG